MRRRIVDAKAESSFRCATAYNGEPVSARVCGRTVSTFPAAWNGATAAVFRTRAYLRSEQCQTLYNTKRSRVRREREREREKSEVHVRSGRYHELRSMSTTNERSSTARLTFDESFDDGFYTFDMRTDFKFPKVGQRMRVLFEFISVPTDEINILTHASLAFAAKNLARLREIDCVNQPVPRLAVDVYPRGNCGGLRTAR